MAAHCKKTLVVDDEEDWRVRTSVSRKRGFEVVVAADASEAMRQAEEPHVGLIILDDYLGGESGLILPKASIKELIVTVACYMKLIR
jgi:DNA-binding response OmpR family regulator